MRLSHCPACRHNTSIRLYRWESMPLGVLSLPKTKKEALEGRTLALDLQRCAQCGHVFHCEINKDALAYADDTTMVFNQGTKWVEHQNTLAKDWAKLAGGNVIEVGCGDGSFLALFQNAGAKTLGFEPGADGERAMQRGLTVRREPFTAETLSEIRPSAVILRHVVEHLTEPLAFLGAIAHHPVTLLLEVPSIEKALDQHRISDFFYEHISHFTRHSLKTLVEQAGFEVIHMELRYGDEVITLAAKTAKKKPVESIPDVSTQTEAFHASIERQIQNAREWKKPGQTIALWGGAGKAAALINMLGLTADKFPIVIDSDPNKAGRFVPGTGQEIQSPSFLRKHPVDGILICTNWRARDIEREIREQHKLNVPLFIQFEEQIVPLTESLSL